MSEYVPAVGDSVRCLKPKGGLKPYTGTVTTIFSGFVRVDFDQAQGPGGCHAFALTAPKNLELIMAGPAKPLINPPEYAKSPVLKTEDPMAVTEHAATIVAPLPPHGPEESPVVAATLVGGTELTQNEQPATGSAVTARAGLA
jgi:hypothetical protein